MEHKKIALNIGSSSNIKETFGGKPSLVKDIEVQEDDSLQEQVTENPDNIPPPTNEPEENIETETETDTNIVLLEKIKNDEKILNEYVDNFYSMKSEYETKKEISVNRKKEDMLSKGKPRHKIIKAISEMKHKCVNCSRQVDMIFSTKQNKLTAKCGSKESPCNLNISINKGTYYPYEKLWNGTLNVKGLKEDIDEQKLSIIKMKLDMVFEFENMQNTLRKFNKVKELLADAYDIFQERNYAYITTVDKYDMTSLAKMELKKEEIINSIKRAVKNYETKPQEIKEVLKRDNIFSSLVDKYINDLSDIIKSINSTKYNIYDVEYEKKSDVHMFIKKEYSYTDTIQQEEEFSIESNIHKEKIEIKEQKSDALELKTSDNIQEEIYEETKKSQEEDEFQQDPFIVKYLKKFPNETLEDAKKEYNQFLDNGQSKLFLNKSLIDAGWTVQYSVKAEKPYYFNIRTNESRYSKPKIK